MKRPLEEMITKLLDQGFRSLPIEMSHAFAIRMLPSLHTDPFDRMLVAQAQCEELTIITSDSAIEAYDVRTLDASE